MKNKISWFAAAAVVGAAIVATVAVVVVRDGQGGEVGAPEAGHGANANWGSAGVSVVPLSDGDKEVIDAGAGYYFSMPSNWYVETSTVGTGALAVYPDYDPAAGGDAATCKIEISALGAKLNSADDLSSWITDHLHADPTADVHELSRTQMTVGGSRAIEWRGVLNSMTTTLVYAAGPEGIWEAVPSTLSESSDADNDDCDIVFEALLNNIHFGNYES